jgi:hypothetical protein
MLMMMLMMMAMTGIDDDVDSVDGVEVINCLRLSIEYDPTSNRISQTGPQDCHSQNQIDQSWSFRSMT